MQDALLHLPLRDIYWMRIRGRVLQQGFIRATVNRHHHPAMSMELGR